MYNKPENKRLASVERYEEEDGRGHLEEKAAQLEEHKSLLDRLMYRPWSADKGVSQRILIIFIITRNFFSRLLILIFTNEQRKKYIRINNRF